METITASELRARIHAREPLALLDVREAGEFGLRHPLWATPLPYSRFELDLPRLVPSWAVPLVIADEDGRIARLAARQAVDLGYRRVRVLDGGLQAWRRAGLGEFAGVHVPSKAFGELVSERRHTPMIDAGDLADRLARGEPFHVFDARPPGEFRRMSIPGARCCPNVELAARFESLVDAPDTPVVVNCAGRTRGIIGAQTLIDLGVPNPVYALRNGTMGWQLAGLVRERGATDVVPLNNPAAATPAWRERIRAITEAAGVYRVDAARIRAWRDAEDPVYCFDVRASEDERPVAFANTQRVPAVQLIQATESWIGVPGAHVVLLDDDGVRAPLCAYWLRVMGLDAAVYVGAAEDLPAAAFVPRPVEPSLGRCTAAEALSQRAGSGGPALLDLRPSDAYRAGHPAGARWITRSRIPDVAPTLLRARHGARLLASDRGLAALFARDLADRGIGDVALIMDGLDGWRAAGGEIVATPDDPPDRTCIDRLSFVSDRHDGNLDAARRYLEWEKGLVPRMEPADLRVFDRLTAVSS